MWPVSFIIDFGLLCLLPSDMGCFSYIFFLVYHLLLSFFIVLITVCILFCNRPSFGSCGTCLGLFLGIGLFVAISCEGAAFSSSRSNIEKCKLYDNFGWTCVITFIGIPIFGCFALFGFLALWFIPYMFYLVVKTCFEN